MMSRGVLYVASGSSFRTKARMSAESVKKHNSSLPVTIYTDEKIEADVFDQVVQLTDPITEPGDSILSREHFPYERNLYLDADTYVCGDINNIFNILENFDIAMAHDIARNEFNKEVYIKNNVDIPDTFVEYNTGVIAYRNSPVVKQLFDDWARTQNRFDEWLNQPALRVALYNSDVELATLPPEYNFMIHRVGYACGEIKILHQSISHVDLSDFAELLNSTDEMRVITHDDYPCRVVPESYRSRQYKLGLIKDTRFWKDKIQRIIENAKRKQKRDGTISLLKAIIRKIS